MLDAPEAGALTQKPAGRFRVLDSNLHRGHFQFLLKLFGFSWDRQDCFVCWEYSGNVCRFPLSFSPVPFLP